MIGFRCLRGCTIELKIFTERKADYGKNHYHRYSTDKARFLSMEAAKGQKDKLMGVISSLNLDILRVVDIDDLCENGIASDPGWYLILQKSSVQQRSTLYLYLYVILVLMLLPAVLLPR